MNYIKLTKPSLLYNHYAYVDTEEYHADALFVHEKVRVYFEHDYKKDGEKYVIVLCKIKKSDEEKFIAAMKRLENKMYILGNKDYSEFWTSRGITEEQLKGA